MHISPSVYTSNEETSYTNIQYATYKELNQTVIFVFECIHKPAIILEQLLCQYVTCNTYYGRV